MPTAPESTTTFRSRGLLARGPRRSVRALPKWFFEKQGWAWLAPVFVFETLHHGQAGAAKLVEALIAIAFVLIVRRHPYRYLSILLVVLPFNTLILATLYRLGLPSGIVWSIGFWKEEVVAGLALAVFNRLQSPRRGVDRMRFDAVDRLVGGYVLLGTAYLLLPKLFVEGAAGAHLSFYLRELGWRTDVLYFAIFLVCRHIGLSRPQVEALLQRVVAVGMVLAFGGFYEFFATKSWLKFVLQTLKLQLFDVKVLKFPNPTVSEHYATLGGHHFPRISSFLFFDNLSFGFYLLICLAIAVELLARGEYPRWMLAALPIIVIALLLNQGRATVLGTALAVVFALRAKLGRSIVHRERLTLAVGLLLVVAIPISIASGLEHRFVSSHSSNTKHSSATQTGLRVMATHPLGRGLGTGAGAGQAAAQRGQIAGSSYLVTENQLLQIGTQLGYLGAGLFIASLLVMEYRLARPRLRPAAFNSFAPAAALSNAMVGLGVGMLVLQPFVVNAVDWTFFSLAGAAMSLLDSAGRETLRSNSQEGVAEPTGGR
jgi:hypothetical protein